MDKSEIEGIRARSKSREDGPWVTDESEMWKKTVVRRGIKPFAGASQSLNAAIEADNEASGVSLAREPVNMPKAIAEASEVKQEASEASEPVKQVAEASAEIPADPPKFITEPQHRRLFALCKGAQMPVETLKEHLYEMHGIQHTNEIPKPSYDAICDYVTKWKPVAE
jgi:hypothetical protein